MAAGGDMTVTDADIAGLAQAVSSADMEFIAESYLGTERDTIATLRKRHAEDTEGFNGDVIRIWANQSENSGSNQVQKLASLLYKAAREGSFIDAGKVQEILGVPPEETETPESETPVTEVEIEELGETLKKHVEHVTKIEMTPWAKEYNEDIDKQYTNLHVEQIENQPTGPEGKKLDDYKELFNQGETRRGRGKRILVKGGPGIGKTTLAKKVVWDWTKGVFTAVSVVLFVSMKLVRPEDAIENIIVRQTPALSGLNVSTTKLRTILQMHGSKVLIILDGFDENYTGNDNITRLLKGEIGLRCNVLVTSRPHNIAEFEEHFHTVLQIQGFTKENAIEFASHVLVDKTKASDVLEIQCLNTGQILETKDPLFTCPMLLFFVCILANNNDLDLSRKTITSGEVYTLLLQSVYKKFLINQGREFQKTEFEFILTSVGSLAFEILVNSQAQFRTVDDMREIGEEAFKVGLIIGYEDYKLSADETADIVIDFPHRTIQEYLTAFFFVQTLNKGRSLIPIFIRYPFVLHFCLWFVNKDLKYFPLERSEAIYRSMVARTSHVLDAFKVKVPSTFTRNMNLIFDGKSSDTLVLSFLQDVLAKCPTIRCLRLCYTNCMKFLMDIIRPLLPRLLLLRLSSSFTDDDDNFDNRVLSHDYLYIQSDGEGFSVVGEILASLSQFEKPLILSCEDLDLKRYCFALSGIENVERLNIKMPEATLHIEEDISRQMKLQQLSLHVRKLSENAVSALGGALKRNVLPNLTSLDLAGVDIQGQLPHLFQDVCPSLKHLTLERSCHQNDTKTLSEGPRLLPELTSLVLSHSNDDDLCKFDRCSPETLRVIFQAPWANLTRLTLPNLTPDEYKQLIVMLNNVQSPKLREITTSLCKHAVIQRLEPVNVATLTHLTLHRFISKQKHLNSVSQSTILKQLEKLDISHSSGITGKLFILLYHSMPSLNTLILSNCGLNLKDLCSLAQAKAKGRLPEVTNLDVSQNEAVVGHLECLFAEGSDWKRLESLNVQQHVAMVPDVDAQAVLNAVHSGQLQALTELGVTTSNMKMLSQKSWDKLHSLEVWTGVAYVNIICDDIADAVEENLLPSLRSVHLSAFQKIRDLSELSEKVELHLTTSTKTDDMVPLNVDTLTKIAHEINFFEVLKETEIVQSMMPKYVTPFNGQEAAELKSQLAYEAFMTEAMPLIRKVLKFVLLSSENNLLHQLAFEFEKTLYPCGKLVSCWQNILTGTPFIEFLRAIPRDLYLTVGVKETLSKSSSGEIGKVLVSRSSLRKLIIDCAMLIPDMLGARGTVGDHIPSVGQNSPGFLRLWKLGVQVL